MTLQPEAETMELPNAAAARTAVLDSFASATDNWTRSALVAAATEQAPSYVAEALTYGRPQALTEFVAAVLPAALPASAERLLVAAAGAGPQASALAADVVRAIARMDGGIYGICVRCGKPVPRKRLEILPFAKRCLKCEGEKERARSMFEPDEAGGDDDDDEPEAD